MSLWICARPNVFGLIGIYKEKARGNFVYLGYYFAVHISSFAHTLCFSANSRPLEFISRY